MIAERQKQNCHALHLKGVTCRFGALVAVSDVNLGIEEGQRHAILGANGAGKTTLFNMISGDIRQSAGRISLFGEDIGDLAPERRVLKGLRRTYQQSLVFGGLSVRANLFLAARGTRGRRFALWESARHADENDHAEKLAERIHLTHRLDHPAGQLSHGEQRQLELGMAIAGEPRVLLLDEPAAGLSLSERRQLLAMLKALPRSITLVLIEHDLDIALAAVDCVTVMHNGVQVAAGTPEQISRNQKVHDIYMGKHVN